MLLVAKPERLEPFAILLTQVWLTKKTLQDATDCFYKNFILHMPIADSLTYVSKIAEKNGISGRTQGAAIAILAEARRKRFAAGKDPMGMAAAALYIACLQHNEKITQKDIADASGVTEVTVRNRYKALKKQLNLEVPERAHF